MARFTFRRALLLIGGAALAAGLIARRDRVAALLPGGSPTSTPPPPPPAAARARPRRPPRRPGVSNYDAAGPAANTATAVPVPEALEPETVDEASEEAAAAAEAANIGGTVADYAGPDAGRARRPRPTARWRSPARASSRARSRPRPSSRPPRSPTTGAARSRPRSRTRSSARTSPAPARRSSRPAAVRGPTSRATFDVADEPRRRAADLGARWLVAALPVEPARARAPRGGRLADVVREIGRAVAAGRLHEQPDRRVGLGGMSDNRCWTA